MPRIVGKQGAVYIGGTAAGNKVADIYNWTLEISQEVAECGVKGEVHEQYALGKVTTKVTAERFVENVGGSTVLTNFPVTQAPASGNNWRGLSVLYNLYGIDAAAGTPPTVGPSISGEGFVTRGALQNPRTMAVDSFEITGFVMPTINH